MTVSRHVVSLQAKPIRRAHVRAGFNNFVSFVKILFYSFVLNLVYLFQYF